MNERFLAAIKHIETADPDNIMKQVFGLFSSISVMTGPEAIAAYETLQFFIARISLEQRELRRQIRGVQTALVNRMIIIMLSAPKGQRVALKISFQKVAVAEMHMNNFHDALAQATQEELHYA